MYIHTETYLWHLYTGMGIYMYICMCFCAERCILSLVGKYGFEVFVMKDSLESLSIFGLHEDVETEAQDRNSQLGGVYTPTSVSSLSDVCPRHRVLSWLLRHTGVHRGTRRYSAGIAQRLGPCMQMDIADSPPSHTITLLVCTPGLDHREFREWTHAALTGTSRANASRLQADEGTERQTRDKDLLHPGARNRSRHRAFIRLYRYLPTYACLQFLRTCVQLREQIARQPGLYRHRPPTSG